MVGAKCHILLVHPSADLLIEMEKALSSAGHSIRWTHLGEEAVVLCQETTFDLVYCYLNMCGMNGLEICSKIMSSRPNTKVILFAISPKEKSEVRLTLWHPDEKKRIFEESCALCDLAHYTQTILTDRK